MSDKETKFEHDLKEYFPDIWKLYRIGEVDPFVWEVVNSMLEMFDKQAFGMIRFTYQNGKINHVYKTFQATARKSNKPEAIIARQAEKLTESESE